MVMPKLSSRGSFVAVCKKKKRRAFQLAAPMADVDEIHRTIKEVVYSVTLHNITDQLSKSIFRFPVLLRTKDNNSPCCPLVVSVGPYHYAKGTELKITYVRSLLQLSGSQYDTLEACTRKVYESISVIRSCYVETESSRYEDLSLFVCMMVVDGCFILGFLNSKMEENEEENETGINYQYFGRREENDLVTKSILKDLLLLENQIPFFLLKDIFELTILKSKTNASLTQHIKRLLEFGHRCLFAEDLTIPEDLIDTKIDNDHILGLLHKCYQHELEFPKSSKTSKIRNAMELEKAGVSFRPNQDASWRMAIEIEYSRRFSWFWFKPTLKIPRLNIHDDSEAFLRNIIAYEHTSEVKRYFTSFMVAIDDLVDNSHDIAKLVESRVIINDLETNEEAANMINNICKNTLICNFYSKQWKELDTYYHESWLRRRYFSNPWNSINLLAGIILFFLSAAQTYFAVNPRK